MHTGRPRVSDRRQRSRRPLHPGLMETLLTVRELRKTYRRGGGVFSQGTKGVRFTAVDGVSFSVSRGETFAVVGESGCGKTTLARMLLRLIEPDGGEIRFEGRDLLTLRGEELRSQRRQMQMVFQDPFASLNPRMRVGEIVAEPLTIHEPGLSATERLARTTTILGRVGLDKDAMPRYPHEFSGGQRQRIGIARALVLRPKLVVADEPVSALDVSIQSQVLNLLVELKQAFGLTYLFVAHDLAVVGYISDRIAVMYLGKIVEFATAADLFARPLHPYTQALLSAIPVPEPGRKTSRIVLRGDVPSPVDPPSGCRFRTRCPLAQQICAEQEPPLDPYGDGHLAACHFAGT